MASKLEVGAVVAGRYRLDRLVGEGGMGVLYAASHLHAPGQGEVAIKLLKDGTELDEGKRRRLLREARAHGAVRHPNVVAIHEVLELEDGAPAIVMDLLVGESLRARLDRERTLPLAGAARLLVPVLSALEAAHALGIVHRDLKPENVFLARGPGGEEKVVVLDFGIAKLTADDGVAAKTAALTSTGTLLGTPFYMAPEQVLGEAIDGRTDLWALGAILYECLTGVRPVEDENVGKVLRRILTGTLRPLAEIAPAVPREVVALVDRLLAFDREQRPAGAADVRAELEAFTSSTLPALPPLEGPLSPLSGRGVSPPATTRAALAEAPTMAAPVTPAAAAAVGPASEKRARPWRLVFMSVALGVASLGAYLVVTRHPSARAPILPAPPPSTSGPCPAEMVFLSGGDFLIGSDQGADDERPVHSVSLRPYCLDATEVTVAAFNACVARGACRPASASVDYGGVSAKDRELESSFCHAYQAGHPGFPINCVSWTHASAYCAAVGKRLPTEVEWERAAAGGSERRRYAWGSALPGPKLLNACGEECARLFATHGRELTPMYAGDDGFPGVAPVGSFPAGDSKDGIHDLNGNLWEWTASPYCAYPAHDCENPNRVFRGGGFITTLGSRVTNTTRLYSAPESRYMEIGFRCAKDAG